MKWIGNRQSDNVEDRRGMSGGGKLALGGGGLAIVFFLLKIFMPESAPLIDNIQNQVQQNQTTTSQSGDTIELTPEQKEIGDFAKTVLAYTEDTWGKYFKKTEWTMKILKWFCSLML